MIKLVLTDIDGTILPAGERRISARTMLAIRNLEAAGIGFGPSSGRERGGLFQPFWGADDLSGTGIFANGKVVYVHGRRVAYHTLERGAVLRLLEEVHPLPDVMFNYFAPHGLDGKSGRSYVAVDFPPEDYGRFEAACRLHTPREFSPTLPEGIDIVSATVYTTELRTADELEERLPVACPGLDFLRSADLTLDVAPHGVTKASALDPLCRELGITRDEILYLGDSDNDLAMMRAVPNSVAMGNATDAAYAAARWCTGPASADSVAVILESLARHAGEVHPEEWTF